MDKEELLAFLKENLKLEEKTDEPAYGGSGTRTLQLKLGDEVISEVYWDLKDGDKNYY